MVGERADAEEGTSLAPLAAGGSCCAGPDVRDSRRDGSRGACGLVTLGGLAAAYVATLTGAAAQIAREERRWDLWSHLVAAFGVVHFAWSSGFAVNFLTASRWPAWNGRGRVAETHGQRGFSGATLLGALLAILGLAFVVPPGLATPPQWVSGLTGPRSRFAFWLRRCGSQLLRRAWTSSKLATRGSAWSDMCPKGFLGSVGQPIRRQYRLAEGNRTGRIRRCLRCVGAFGRSQQQCRDCLSAAGPLRQCRRRRRRSARQVDGA